MVLEKSSQFLFIESPLLMRLCVDGSSKIFSAPTPFSVGWQIMH